MKIQFQSKICNYLNLASSIFYELFVTFLIRSTILQPNSYLNFNVNYFILFLLHYKQNL